MILTANANTIAASLLVDQLYRCGIRRVVISPGSRSTPLVVAFASHTEVDRQVHWDERGAGYFALGWAKAARSPVALVSTSGTAVANYLPSVVEAHQDRVPLVLLTADRPPELQNCGANQTIMQPGIFSTYVAREVSLECPGPSMDPRQLTELVAETAQTCVREAKPVHINCPFREPLAPDPDPNLPAPLKILADEWGRTPDRPVPSVDSENNSHSAVPAEVAGLLRTENPVILVAGMMDDDHERSATIKIARRLSCPVLPDIQSGLRLSRPNDQTIEYYDLILHAADLRSRLRPALVLHCGGRVTSKRLLNWLADTRPETYVIVGDRSNCFDPNHQVTQRLECSVQSVEAALSEEDRSASNSHNLGLWRAASRAVRELLDEMSDTEELLDPTVARILSSITHAGDKAPAAALYVAGSLPVRLFDSYAGSGPVDILIGANRGASGIDGTIASACGFARGLRRPVTLVIGDLAFLHDLNSLALVRQSQQPVRVVLINNDGGGIFSLLPIARYHQWFEQYFVTPHGLTFKHAARQFDLPYTRCTTRGEFAETYLTSAESPQSSIIELTVSREKSAAFISELSDRIIERLSTL
jgi:2-succinyl-5-enolpyruvyl-6-hydroxy-3-cyclohexene-1-carboxylate synthase